MSDDDRELISLYVAETGIDATVIARYVKSGIEPPSREVWLSQGVPMKHRAFVHVGGI